MDMVADLFRDGGTFFVKEGCNPFEGSALIESSVWMVILFSRVRCLFLLMQSSFNRIRLRKPENCHVCIEKGYIRI